MGVNSVLELQSCSLASLQIEFGDGPLALTLKRLSHGIDDADVIISGAPKSMSEEDTYHECSSLNVITKNLQNLANNLILRLTADVGCPQTIRLTIRRGIGELAAGDRKESRQGPIPSKFSSSKLSNDQKLSVLLSVTLELFKKLVNVKQPFKIKLLNICLTNFQKPSKCGQKAFSSFFRSGQDNTTSTESATDHSEISFEPECLNSIQDTTQSSGHFESKFSQHKISHPLPSNSENKNSVSGNLKSAKGVITSLHGINSPSEDALPFENKHNSETVKITNSSSSTEIPSDVDPEIFNCLPLEVQRELLEQWKQERSSHVKNTQKQPTGLLKYFSRPS
jgi:DNA polymerase iota